jgi:glycosyltransferase involved in cell wall biosynthesis
LNIRLLWNVNHHELPSPIPYVRTIWDINHRIHSLFPEYSHTRLTFSGIDRNVQDSLARASYVVTGTEVGRHQLVTIYGVSDTKIRVIPFPTPSMSQHLKDETPQKRGDFIFYPARFWPHKNHAVIIEALSILRQRHDWSLKCVLTGADEGNLRYVLGYAERLGVRDLIDYRGNVSEEELVALYKTAFALVFASAVGPDNLPPLEAMSLQCPVLTSDVPGAREQFGDAAIFFTPTNEQALAQRLMDLRDDAGLRQRLVNSGNARAAAFTVEDYADRMVAVLDEFSLLARNWQSNDSAFT